MDDKEKVQKNKVDKDSDKYKVTLKFVNKILTNLEKQIIDDLTDFRDIDRVDMLKDVNKQTLKDMEAEIFQHYNKNSCGYYRKSESMIVNCLRHMVKALGLQLVRKQKDVSHVIEGVNFRKTHIFYSIQKK